MPDAPLRIFWPTHVRPPDLTDTVDTVPIRLFVSDVGPRALR